MDTAGGSLEPDLLLRDLGWVQALSRQLVRDADGAKDVEQETWLAALRRTWPGGAPPRRWLAHVARNAARLRVRGDERRRAREHDAAVERTVPAPEELVERMETQRRLAEAVLALPEPYRTLILLRHVEDLEPAAIARAQGVPAATVRSRLRRGLEMLRADLDRRSRGDRQAWMSSLAIVECHPTPEQTLPQMLRLAGIVLSAKWIALGSAVLLVLAAVWWSVQSPAPHADGGPVLTDTAAHPPEGSEGSEEAALRDPHNEVAREAAVALPVAAAGPAPFTCRLVDDRTGDAVANLEVVLVAPDGAREPAESDELGIVRAARTSALSEVTIDLPGTRHPSDLVQTQRDAAAAVPLAVRVEPRPPDAAATIDVRVPVGPTYELQLALPAGLRAPDFTATLTSADSRQAFDRLHAVLHEPRHPGGLVWARFSGQARAMSGGPPWKVTVGSRDGLWSGSALTDVNAGNVRPPLPLVLSSTARVRGRVSDGGTPIEAGQFVQFRRAGASFADTTNRPIVILTDAEGRYDARWVSPGSYTISVEVVGSQAYEAAVDAQGGTTIEHDVELVPEARDGSLSVRVTSTTGTYTGPVRLVVQSPAGVRYHETKTVTWSLEGGAQVGRVRFEGLERTRHRIDAIVSDGVPISPRRVEAEADGSEVSLHVLDETPMRELHFDLRDADSDERIVARTFRVEIPSSAGDAATEGGPRFALVDKTKHTTRLPDAPHYEVEVLADGYRPLRVRIDRPGGSDPVSLRMQKGWGIDLRAVDTAGVPLAGVRIECDGIEVGVTDARGELRFDLDAAPVALHPRLEGWRTAQSSNTDPQTGRFRSWMPWVRVVMEPDPR